MTNNPNELTIENSVLVLIDHQPAVALAVHSIDHGTLINNVAALARVAKALGVPTVLITVGAQGSNVNSQRGDSNTALLFDWITAHVKAGTVQQPDVPSVGIPVGAR